MELIKSNIIAKLKHLKKMALQRNINPNLWQKSSSLKVGLITEKGRIPESQIFPFYYYEDELKSKWNVEFKEFDINEFEHKDAHLLSTMDRIIFQPWFDKGEDKIVRMLQRIKAINPQAKIAFFDSYAPSDLRFAEAVNPYIDWYVKKHVFRDRHEYEKSTLGDTSLVEYYNHLYGIADLPSVAFKVPDSFLSKLIVGPSFFTSEKMLPAIGVSKAPFALTKKFNMHARLGAQGSPWYAQMRQHALKAGQSATDENQSILTADATSTRRYMRELRASSICFSPFGYGEACWRDYEAVFCGALLIKPDMSHIETQPDIFIANQTYVPIAWDFSDLQEKVSYYLSNEQARTTIIENAYSLLYEYVNSAQFIEQLAPLFI